jgi:hypothetical protein
VVCEGWFGKDLLNLTAKTRFSEGEERLLVMQIPTCRNIGSYAAQTTFMKNCMDSNGLIFDIATCKRTISTAVSTNNLQ